MVSKIEKEVNRIRLEIYEETKDMTPQERREYFREQDEAVTKKYGFKVYGTVEGAERDEEARMAERTR